MADRTFDVLSLCSGVGGLDLGIALAVPAARTVCFIEREGFACEILATRMEEGWLDPAPVWTDLRTFDGAEWRGLVDCVAGGYPCQPFSLSGRRHGRDDPRHLWPHVARVVRECEPTWCFFENVPGHVSLGLEEVVCDLEGMGYRVACGLFSAAEAGASHRRERLFLLAHDQSRLGDVPHEGETRGVHPSPHEVSRSRIDRQPGGRSGPVGVPTFPPLPRDDDGWDAYLRENPGAAPSLESDVRGSPNGVADRVDRLRATGNGVVPLVAGYAWRTLESALRD